LRATIGSGVVQRCPARWFVLRGKTFGLDHGYWARRHGATDAPIEAAPRWLSPNLPSISPGEKCARAGRTCRRILKGEISCAGSGLRENSDVLTLSLLI
jgi:hypothetical protein